MTGTAENHCGFVTGAMSKVLTSDEERAIYEQIMKGFREAYPDLDNAADEINLRTLAFHTAKLQTAMVSDKEGNMTFHGSRVTALMKMLGIRRDVRMKEKPPADPTNELLKMLVESASNRRKGLPQGSGAALPSGDGLGPIIEADAMMTGAGVVEGGADGEPGGDKEPGDS